MGQAVPASPVGVHGARKPGQILLALATIAVIGLTALAIILAEDGNNGGADVSVANRGPAPAQTTNATRYDGGPEEGTHGVAREQPSVYRYDGGPEEGSAAISGRSVSTPSGTEQEQRSDPHGTAAQLHQLGADGR